jgi:hypothetical protein
VEAIRAAALQTAVTKLQQDNAKRVQAYGPRMYRHEDGSLQPTKPAPNPFAVASRKGWAELVHYCRVHGGDIDVQQTGLEPEVNADGSGWGLTPASRSPLTTPLTLSSAISSARLSQCWALCDRHSAAWRVTRAAHAGSGI